MSIFLFFCCLFTLITQEICSKNNHLFDSQEEKSTKQRQAKTAKTEL